MDKFESLRAFTHVVEQGGFAAAARTMGLSRSAVNKAVIALERELGVQLLRRSTRQVTPTEAGTAFHTQAKLILGQLDDAISAVREQDARPAGALRVNAPMSFGTLHLSPVIAEFIARWPAVHLELVLNDRFVDPIEEGFDVTLRAGEPRASTSLAAKEVAPVRRVLCAAPDYLAAHGEPMHPRELKAHRCLHYGYQDSGNLWRLANGGRSGGGEQSFAIGCVMWSNNGEVLRDTAIAGGGIALLPTFIVGAALQQGQLLSVLADWAPPPIALCALYPRHRFVSPKVRAFVDLLGERFGDRPYWDLAS